MKLHPLPCYNENGDGVVTLTCIVTSFKVGLLQTKAVLIEEIQKNLAEKDKTISEKKEELKTLDAELVALKESSARVKTNILSSIF